MLPMTVRNIPVSFLKILPSKILLCPSPRPQSFHAYFLSTSQCLWDWRRNNTPRKPELYRIPKTATVLEEELISLQTPVYKSTPEDDRLAEKVRKSINTAITDNHSRYFAVVHLAGKQFKITTEDLIMVKTPLFGTDVGDKIRLEKVLLVGSNDFSLIGRPVLGTKEVYVEAQVVEKTLEYPKLWYQFHRRRRHQKMRVFQDNVAVLRITKIVVNPLEEEVQ
ncbi:unnamed protein product [Calicophoron daubneyi]|uniref:Large ribosomal subunit protein bL21m n=1 Tax=Calicophoron daubneyi TaxID=300641 RepID=A0AAV2T553_CALDB